MSAKLVLSKVPIPYSAWSRLNLFRHGKMDSAEYAISCFDTHWQAWRGTTPPATVLEIGPGDSIASAFIARARGVSKTYLVDAGYFAHQRLEDYRALIAHFDPGEKSAELLAAPTIDELLRFAHCSYLTEGVKSLASIPDASVDLLFSHATLEHVPAGDLAELMHQTRRILKPGGVVSHQIDLRDHLGGGLNNLRFSHNYWRRTGCATVASTPTALDSASLRGCLPKRGSRCVASTCAPGRSCPSSGPSSTRRFAN
jgi:SAM-dependent methyltransferase